MEIGLTSPPSFDIWRTLILLILTWAISQLKGEMAAADLAPGPPLGAVGDTPEKIEAVRKSAEEYRAVGNKLFSEKHFDAACKAYTKAIEVCDTLERPGDLDLVHIYLSNRAQCHIKLENYGSAVADASRAVELKPDFSKGYYRRGCANIALQKFHEALKDFQTAGKHQATNEILVRIRECQREIRQQKFGAAIAGDNSSDRLAGFLNLLPGEVSGYNSSNKPIDLEALEKQWANKPWDGPRYYNKLESSKSPNLSPEQQSEPSEQPEPSEPSEQPEQQPPPQPPQPHTTTTFLSDLIAHLRTPGNTVHPVDAVKIVQEAIELLKSLPSLVEITIEQGKTFTVCGDVHGQFYDLCNIFSLNGLPSPQNPYLFNGDFVDRGSFSTECIFTLLAAKLLYPEHVHLARGNHETRNMNSLYGFQGEVRAKYSFELYDLFCECFRWLPLAHVINKKIFVVHGGLLSSENVTLEDIKNIDRNREPPDDGIMADLLWSDPQPNPGRAPSKRGVACCFGPDITEAFLKNNNLELVIRSHEMKEVGYEIDHNGKLVTVFSAPNYCDQMGNLGAFVRIKNQDGKLSNEFITFAAVPHPPVPSMQFANPLCSLLQ